MPNPPRATTSVIAAMTSGYRSRISLSRIIWVFAVSAPPRHGGEEDARLHRERLRRLVVVVEALAEQLLDFADLHRVDPKVVLGAVERLPEGQEIGLAGAAGNRVERTVDLVRPCIDRAHVLLNAETGGLVAMEDDVGLIAEQLACAADRLVHDRRSGRT